MYETGKERRRAYLFRSGYAALPSMHRHFHHAGLSQSFLLRRLLVALHLIARLERRPILEAHATLGTFSHLRDVLFDILEGGKRAWDHVSAKGMGWKIDSSNIPSKIISSFLSTLTL